MTKIEDEKVQKISSMLEIGATMLAQHCNVCGAPMFRYQGRVLCPVCEKVSDPRPGIQQAAQPVQSASQTAAETSSSESQTIQHEAKSVPENMVVAGAADEFLSRMGSTGAAPLSETSSLSGELESLLMAKMVSIARTMQDEADARLITDHMDLIERGISIIAMLRKNM